MRSIDSVPLTPDAIAAASRAAAAAGISLQAWLTRVILRNVAESGEGDAPPNAADAGGQHPGSAGAAKVREALEQLAKKEAERDPDGEAGD